MKARVTFVSLIVLPICLLICLGNTQWQDWHGVSVPEGVPVLVAPKTERGLLPAPTRTSVTGPAASAIVSLHSTPYGEDPAPILKAFQIDCVGWGISPQREVEVDGWAKAWIRRHLDAGVRYHAVLSPNISNGYLTGPEPELLVTRCVTADGSFRGPRHTGVMGIVYGQPPWWHCVNHPAWRENLKKRVGYALAAGAQGIHFDDPRSGASPEFRKEGICFCDYCISGFERAFPDLEPKGASLKAHLAKSLAATPLYPRDPLLRRYLIYQLKSAVRCVEEVIAHARAIGGSEVQFTVNAFDMTPESLAFVHACDWLLTEISHYASLWNSGVTLGRSLAWRYRLADAFGKRMCATAPFWEWRYLQDHKCTNLLKLWFAAAYAHGHLFTVPNYYAWSGIPYRGDPRDFAPLIQFVKDNRQLLDDYVHVASVAVIFSPNDISDITGDKKALAELMDISMTLVYRQLDFHFAIANNKFFDAPPWPDAPLIILPQTAHLSADDMEKLKPYESSGRLLRWPQDRFRIESLRTINVPEGVWVKPRVHRSDLTRWVYHLLNGRFNYVENKVERIGPFALRFAVPKGWTVVEATYHEPGSEAKTLKVRVIEGKAEVTIPSLEYWGLLSVRFSSNQGSTTKQHFMQSGRFEKAQNKHGIAD